MLALTMTGRVRTERVSKQQINPDKAGVGVGLRGVLGRRRRGEAGPEDLRGGAAAGGRRGRGRGARGGAPHRRQHAQGLRTPRRGALAAVRRARAPGPRCRAGVARRGGTVTGRN